MAEIGAVVFDFDGVLANSEPLHLQSYQAVLGEVGVTLGRDDALPALSRLRRRDGVQDGERAPGLGWNGEEITARSSPARP